MNQKLFNTRADWRAWLKQNHDKEKEIWLVFYKVRAKKNTLKYEDAVQEALCFGWIDSMVRRIDDEKHTQKYTPRKRGGNWSESNKRRIANLQKAGLLDQAGIDAVESAKQDGSWDRLTDVEVKLKIPPELATAFAKNKKAKTLYDELAPSHKKQYLWWIVSAKRIETKEKRIKEMMKMLTEKKSTK